MEILKILSTEEEKQNFLIGLVFLSKLDGVVDENEKIFFANAGASLALSEESIRKVNESWDALEMPTLKFNTKKGKLFFLREAMQLSFVDGSYNDKEKKFLEGLVKEFDLNLDELKAIEDWVQKGMEWKALGERLIDVEG